MRPVAPATPRGSGYAGQIGDSQANVGPQVGEGGQSVTRDREDEVDDP